MRNLFWGATCLLFILFAAVLPVFADSCLTSSCHKPIAELKNIHQPVKDDDCTACHVKNLPNHPNPGGKSFSVAFKGQALCSQCHDPLGKNKIVHEPVKGGDCVACHKPHGAAGRALLNVSNDQSSLCMECHESAMLKQPFIHGPVAVGSCTECHNPHESAEKSLLKKPTRNLCLSCHDDMTKVLKDDPVVHEPLRSDSCTACHDAHGSKVKGILKSKVPDLCIECHPEIGKRMTGVKHPHKPLLAEGGCSTCHSPHSAKVKGLLSAGERQVCLSCHSRNDLGKPPLANMKNELEGKKYLHGPLQNGQCKECHDPHGSDNFRMLRGRYPDGVYAPYKEGIYSACLGCHNKNLLSFAETTLYTAFRNGSRNLHYLHVVNSRKGRTCRICHAPHASNGVKLIDKDGAKIGEWSIPINFQITPTGGSCAPGCHRAFGYDREKPVVY